MMNPQLEAPSPQQFAEYAQQVELRISALEQDLLAIKSGHGPDLPLAPSTPPLSNPQPWWVTISGSFADNPRFDDAVRYGAQWRNSAAEPLP
jgi:hypothetical protein